jgi:S1-C subfamily serine protease
MKKLIIALSLVALVIPNLSFAQAQPGQTLDIFTTVKIVAHKYTRNGMITPKGSGSATILTSNGLILTNNHVVTDEEDEPLDAFEICFTFKNGQDSDEPICEYTAALIARNEDMDLALLKVRSQDIRGERVGKMPFLAIDDQVDIEVGDDVTIIGYPGTGGDTITTTKGQVSGFEKRDDAQYIKTDTDISGGNSGGTAINNDGQFVGVPTYVRSQIDNLGYMLDIREGQDWIEEMRTVSPVVNKEANAKLEARNRNKNDTDNNGRYLHQYYPNFAFNMPADWELKLMNHNTVVAGVELSQDSYFFTVQVQESPVTVTEELLQRKVFRPLEKQKEYIDDYVKEKTTFNGYDGYFVSYKINDTHAIRYIIPYGYTIIVVKYNIDLSKDQEDKVLYEEVAKSFEIKSSPLPFPLEGDSLEWSDPAFDITAPDTWHILPNNDAQSEELIATLAQFDNLEGTMVAYYDEFTESEKGLSATELLEKVINDKKFQPGYRLVNKSDDITIGGLEGFSLTYLYEGSEYQQTRKKSEVFLINGEDFYLFYYDDLDTVYSENVESFKQLLSSFQNKDPQYIEAEQPFKINSLNHVFKDINYHRFEREITVLKERDVIDGYPDGNFYPERNVSRIEALKMIIQGKIDIKEDQEDFELTTALNLFEEGEFVGIDFEDIKDESLVKYARYAKKNNIAQGYSETRFGPDQNVTLAQATKMIITLFEIPVWQNTDDTVSLPWYKSYVDKGYELNIIPSGLGEPEKELTRSEFSAILVNVLEQAED